MRIVFISAVCLGFSAVGAAAEIFGFCGNYRQTASNAGHCPSCALMMADNPKLRLYSVTSNNGWSADLFWQDDVNLASGEGEWGDVGGSFAGKGFAIDMVIGAGGSRLEISMTHHDPQLAGTIVATFECMEPSDPVDDDSGS